MIKILDSFVADKIAAGEVIERPVSIVKELVENSIDAGSRSIIVEIRNGGKSYIRVTDDGCGISGDEVETAFERHATSKLDKLEDLGNIRSLGFRGEALASISAVSRLTIVSKTEDGPAGTKLIIHGGNKVSSEVVGTNNGTTIVIEDVFYNTPARRKFMGSDAREASAIIELIEHYAIFYSDIRFMLINNSRTIFTTDGRGDTLTAIRTVYPTSDYSNLIKIDSGYVKGYISDPGTTKSSKRGQLFFVNGRLVNSEVIEKGIEKGYGSRIFSGYPIAILFITIEPDLIDVNIHPGKKEIKFLYPERIIEEIFTAINDLMCTGESIPSAANIRITSSTGIHEKRIPENKSELYKNLSDDKTGTYYSVLTETGSETISEINPELSELKENRNDIEQIEQSVDIREYLSEIKRDYSEFTENIMPPMSIVHEEPKDIFRPESFDFRNLEYKGYIFNTYIIMQKADYIYIFDQHAAHERIYYEHFLNNYMSTEQIPQPMLIPIIINTSADVYESGRDWMTALEKMGFDIGDFGINTFIMRGIPSYMSPSEAEAFANTFIENADKFELNQTVVDKLIMKACKAAVKGKDILSEIEINELIEKLSVCTNPFSCPHGRPTFVKLSEYDVEKVFKRT